MIKIILQNLDRRLIAIMVDVTNGSENEFEDLEQVEVAKTIDELNRVPIDPEFELGMRAYRKVAAKYADALQKLAHGICL